MNRVLAIARATLRDQRGGVAGLSLTTFGLALMMGLIYPSYRDSFAEIEIPAFFEGFLGEAGSLGSPAGFLTAEVFSWLPVLVAVFAVVWGTGTLAGDEASGELDPLLALPVRRREVLAGKALGLGAGLSAVTLALFPGLLIGAAVVGMDIGAGRLAGATLAQVPLVLLYLAVGMLAAAALRTRRAAAVVTTASLVAAYTVQIVAGAVPDLAGLESLTPLHWADASAELTEGPQPLRWLGLTAVALAL
ncbi:MAG: ABC transporter permease subunit, partial [Miltoncostaeaceae bacterium]